MRGDVWAVFHRADQYAGDVAVGSEFVDDPLEWQRAQFAALRNMNRCQREAQRWSDIAEELADGASDALTRQYEKDEWEARQ